MAINTFDHIQLVARPLLNANAPFPLNQSFDRDMAVFTFDLLDLLSVMAFSTILHETFSHDFHEEHGSLNTSDHCRPHGFHEKI